jgi:hypothetical protein
MTNEEVNRTGPSSSVSIPLKTTILGIVRKALVYAFLTHSHVGQMFFDQKTSSAIFFAA